LVVVRVELVVVGDRRRRHVVAAAPDLHLLGPEALGRLRLVAAGEVAVVALVQPPVPFHGDPRAVHRPQRQLHRVDGAGLQRGVGHVGGDAALGHQAPRLDRLPLAELGELGVPPAGEEVQLVPLALAVAEQHVTVHGHGPDDRPGEGPARPGTMGWCGACGWSSRTTTWPPWTWPSPTSRWRATRWWPPPPTGTRRWPPA